jgi:hypothetical protein
MITEGEVCLASFFLLELNVGDPSLLHHLWQRRARLSRLMVATEQVWENNEMGLRQGKGDYDLDLQKAVVASYAKSCYDSF